jgi:hypothetical protein
MQPSSQPGFTFPPPLPPGFMQQLGPYPSPFVQGQSYLAPPALPSLPELSDDDDDYDTNQPILPSFAQSSVSAIPARKVAGSRRSNVVAPQSKGKGKASTHSDDASSSVLRKRKALSALPSAVVEPPVKKKAGRGGRVSGAPNYSDEDVTALLDACTTCLPLGAKTWLAVEQLFAEWAESHDRPARSAKSLEIKFKQVSSYLLWIA